jgi:Tol biopolymer transport system component
MSTLQRVSRFPDVFHGQLFRRRPTRATHAQGDDDNSVDPSLSPDGRFVVFTSAANGLTSGGNMYPGAFIVCCCNKHRRPGQNF